MSLYIKKYPDFENCVQNFYSWDSYCAHLSDSTSFIYFSRKIFANKFDLARFPPHPTPQHKGFFTEKQNKTYVQTAWIKNKKQRML